MRFSLVLACGLVLAATTMAGSAESGLPGVGTFHYSGAPLAYPTPLVVAVR